MNTGLIITSGSGISSGEYITDGSSGITGRGGVANFLTYYTSSSSDASST